MRMAGDGICGAVVEQKDLIAFSLFLGSFLHIIRVCSIIFLSVVVPLVPPPTMLTKQRGPSGPFPWLKKEGRGRFGETFSLEDGSCDVGVYDLISILKMMRFTLRWCNVYHGYF
jgi:hypothetical protein